MIIIGNGYGLKNEFLRKSGHHLVRRELVFIGFDEEGNFYEERILWKEGEE